jgi:hypothetical protein
MTRNIKKRLAASTVLAGCAVIVSTPAYGAVAPEPEPPGIAGQPSQSVIDHYKADTTGHQSRTFPTAAEQPNKAAVERAEREAAGGSSAPGVLSAQTKAQVEHLEAQVAQQEAAATEAATGSTSDDDGVSTPLVVLALLGGGLITGAAGTYTVRRIRHNGPVSTATA